MNKLGIQIRKIDINDNGKKYNPTTNNLNKQLKTLHRKLQKKDKDLITTYTIEKDNQESFIYTYLSIIRIKTTFLINYLGL